MGAWSQECSRAFPGGLVVRIQHFPWVQPLVREPRYHKPWGVAKKKKKKKGIKQTEFLFQDGRLRYMIWYGWGCWGWE